MTLPAETRRNWVRTNKNISVRRQCELLHVSRSRINYKKSVESPYNLNLMRLIDECYLRHPEYGYPRMTDYLEELGYNVNHKRVSRLMSIMGLQAITPGPHTSKPSKGHKVYPYLLRGVKIERVNQVWSTDFTYIPMPNGFMYLSAVIDWYSRYVLSWTISNTMETTFCLETLEESLSNYEAPEIFNTDQGSQYTSEEFTKILLDKEIPISMDGKGRAIDNVFIERLWWTVKYENVYPHAYESGDDLYHGLKIFFEYYNNNRKHSSLQKLTPSQVYFETKGA